MPHETAYPILYRVLDLYRPEKTVTGPAYGVPLRILATLIVAGLTAYGISVAARFPLAEQAAGLHWMLAGFAALLVTSYWFLMNATVTVDVEGIRQTSLIDRYIAWKDIRSARFMGIPHLEAVFPPRLIVRGAAGRFITFHAGSRNLQIEFARIALAYSSSSSPPTSSRPTS